MIIFNSLKDVSDFAHDLVINYSIEDLKKFNPETIIDFTVGAKYHFAKITKEFANLLGLEIKWTQFLWSYRTPVYCAWCMPSVRRIDYDARLLFGWSYNSLIEIIVHELTHFQVRHHTFHFWEQLLVNMKALGIIESHITFDEFFVKQRDNVRYVKTDKLICFSIFQDRDPIMRSYSQKCIDTYCILRKNKVFDFECLRFLGIRCAKEHYYGYVDSVESAYQNYEEITLHYSWQGRNHYDSFRGDRI